LEARFNNLQYNFTETQSEVIQLSANISTINKNMHSSIAASIEELKEDLNQDITTQLEYVGLMICTKMHIPADPPLFEPPFYTEVETSSHSHNIHPHHFQHDLHLPRVDVTKFDGSNPTGWVTQMEQYFSLYDITNDLAKLQYGVLHLDQERWQWRETSHQGYVAWTHFVEEIYERFDTDTNHLGHLTKLKQFGIVEDFIVSFERQDFHTEGMSDACFQEFFISGLKDEICAHVLMARTQSWVEATKRDKEAQQVVSSQTKNPLLFLALNQ
jgi:hypothetical protein